MRAVLRIDPPLVRDVFEHLLKEAGIDVVASASNWLELLMVVGECRPEVVFLMAGGSSGEPGICSHLLSENPQLKVVIMSTDHYAIADVGVRTMSGDALTVKAIRASLRALLDD
jgi:DNA-binding NarL/FixJ family response regulator